MSARRCASSCPRCSGSSSTADPTTRESTPRSEEHTSELQSLAYLVCRLLLEKKKKLRHQPRDCHRIHHLHLALGGAVIGSDPRRSRGACEQCRLMMLLADFALLLSCMKMQHR